MTRKELLQLIAKISMALRTKGNEDVLHAFAQRTAPDAEAAVALLREVAGKTKLDSAKALRSLALGSVLPGLPPELVKKLGGAAAASGYVRPLATALLGGVRKQVGKVIAAVQESQAAKFDPLLAQLNMSTDQLVACLRNNVKKGLAAAE